MPANRFLFVGVSTGQSSIMQIFPKWSDILGLNAEIQGCDVPLRAPPVTYRRILRDIVDDPAVKGALITAHKIDLLNACRDSFDALDHYARICDEVSCIVKRDGQVLGLAKDPLSAAAALVYLVPHGYWTERESDVLCLGAGGAAIAISVYMAQANSAFGHPRRFILTDILPERLESIKRIHERLDTPIQFEYHLSRSAADSDALLHKLPQGSLIINATGMGKDRPGSPLSDAALLPQDGLVWELNYRGERRFLRQALAQEKQRNLTIADGWMYFLHGWTQVIAEVFQIPRIDESFHQLAAAADSPRAQ